MASIQKTAKSVKLLLILTEILKSMENQTHLSMVSCNGNSWLSLNMMVVIKDLSDKDMLVSSGSKSLNKLLNPKTRRKLLKS